MDLQPKYLWAAIFDDGHIINQPEDRNEDQFKEVDEYEAKMVAFGVGPYAVNLETGLFATMDPETNGSVFFSLEDIELKDRHVYYRLEDVPQEDGSFASRYVLGYSGLDEDGEKVKRVIYIPA